jgi:hypothetical protein
MVEIKWTDERCEQLTQLEKVLREVANANSANNFLSRMAVASELAESLLNGPYPSFASFLKQLAIDDRQNHKAEEDNKSELTLREQCSSLPLSHGSSYKGLFTNQAAIDDFRRQRAKKKQAKINSQAISADTDAAWHDEDK